MRALFVIGRAIFGGFFVYNGINHFRHADSMRQYAASKNVPAPDRAVQATGALLLAGGWSVITGVKPRQGLAMLITFLLPTSLQMHRFWEVDDPQAQQAELTNFMKNMALIGAALALMQIDEPWPVSVDLPAASEQMFVRLGDRELPRLPA